jgi:hypothetical protein
VSDFLYSASPGVAPRLAAVLRRFPGLPDAEIAESGGEWGSLAAVLPAHERHAVRQDAARTTVVLGSPVVRLPGLAPAPVLVGERRRLLHVALADPAFSPGDVLDGEFLALLVDHASGELRVTTDRFSFIPVFAGTDAAGARVLGTHVDAVAHAAERTAMDPVSAADLVANLTCTFPYTAYAGVEQLAPGSTHVLPRGLPAPAPEHYWQPREVAAFASLADASLALRSGLRESVRASCAGSERAGVLLSGGEDSRAVLAAVPAGTVAEAFIYAEWESREVRVARAAALAYGASLHVGLRAPDHYVAGFDRTASLLGSHHLFVDLHGLGLHATLGLDTMPVVLGGLSADSLLKATYSPARSPVAFHTPRLPHLREELLQQVDVRRNAFRQRLLELRPDSADEWLQLWPFSMRKHGGNVDGNRRLFRAHEAFHATAVLEVATASPAAWKRHRRLYHRALRPLFAASRFVPHAEYRFPYYNRLGNLLLVPALLVARGARGLLRGELRARHRPWPRWSALVNSPATRAREQSLLQQSRLLRALLDGQPGPAAADLAEWPALRRLMLLQLAFLAEPLPL